MYFNRYPTIKTQDNEITDITIRFGFVDGIKNNVNTYSRYIVREGEKPEDIAYNLYGDVSYIWLVLVMNDMVDPIHDWVMSTTELNDYINIKYNGNANGIHHYKDTSGYIVPSTEVGAIPVTNKEYEDEINEAKREIKLLKPQFLPQVIEEFERELNA